jgi:hypothetical protein
MGGKTVLWSANAQAQLSAIDHQTALEILHSIDD